MPARSMELPPAHHLPPPLLRSITVGRATTSNVISQAAGFNLNLDHHRGGPFG